MNLRQLIATLACVVGLVSIACTGSSGPTPSSTPTQDATESIRATRWFRTACRLPLEHIKRIDRGDYPGRSPDLTVVPRAPHMYATFDVTTHAGPWGYLQRVPLVLWGPGFVRPAGAVEVEGEVTLADLTPTLASLLDLDVPESFRRRALQELITSEEGARPRLVVVVVWDGGGWNVLREWPGAWPNLTRLMREGASVTNAVVGSSPSVTPAVHATIGTGTFPSQHGIVDIFMRSGDEVVDSFAGQSPENLLSPTLADRFDLSEGNEPKVAMIAERSWHLGMIGHGALSEGGDEDIAVMDSPRSEDLMTTPGIFSLPSYLRHPPGLEEDVAFVDTADGEADGAWLRHDVLDDIEGIRNSPAWIRYQGRLLRKLIVRAGFGGDEAPDLLYTNFKQIDEIGHIWNMFGPEMRDGLRYTDEELGDLLRLLDREVGRGRYVVAVTADHGIGPDPRRVGAWPIGQSEVVADIGKFAGVAPDRLVDVQRPTGYWFHREALPTDMSVGDIADFLLDYTIGDNVVDRAEKPERYRTRLRERLFAAAFPSEAIGEIHRCALKRRP